MKRLPSQLTTITLLLVSGLLTGCSEQASPDAVPTSEPTARSSSDFGEAERDALLAKAVQVIEGYNATVVSITADASIDVSVLSAIGTDEAVDELRIARDDLFSRGQRLVGTSVVRNALLQEGDQFSETVTVLTCEDFTSVRLLDATGADVTPPERDSMPTMKNVLVRGADGLKVRESVAWPGAGIC